MSPSRIAAGRRRAARAISPWPPHRPASAPSPPTRRRGRAECTGARDSTPQQRLRPARVTAKAPASARSAARRRARPVPRSMCRRQGKHAPITAAGRSGQADRAATSARRFQCRLDGGDWSDCCQSPYPAGRDSPPGPHHLRGPRLQPRSGRAAPPPSHTWRRVAPARLDAPRRRRSSRSRSRSPPQDPEATSTRRPAASRSAVRVTNPNDVAIEVTASASRSPATRRGCPAENFELDPAGVSPDRRRCRARRTARSTCPPRPRRRRSGCSTCRSNRTPAAGAEIPTSSSAARRTDEAPVSQPRWPRVLSPPSRSRSAAALSPTSRATASAPPRPRSRN